MSERESMQYDVVIVGAGPAGLSAAIRLKQLANEAGRELSVCILEKGSEVGAHILSGAVIDPMALNELIPDWKEKGSPLTVPVTENHHWVLGARRKWAIPALADAAVHEQQGHLHAEPRQFLPLARGAGGGAGVEIFPGFPAAEILFNEDGSVKGVATGDMGIARDGSHRARLPAGHGAARPLHLLRRGRARPSDQAPDRAVRASRRKRSAGLWSWNQGIVGGSCREA